MNLKSGTLNLKPQSLHPETRQPEPESPSALSWPSSTRPSMQSWKSTSFSFRRTCFGAAPGFRLWVWGLGFRVSAVGANKIWAESCDEIPCFHHLAYCRTRLPRRRGPKSDPHPMPKAQHLNPEAPRSRKSPANLEPRTLIQP